MTTDARLLQRAARLLREQLNGPAQIHPDPSWVTRAQGWLEDYSRHAETTRWREISNDGTVAQEAAPEQPDEHDEGETGPEQTEG